MRNYLFLLTVLAVTIWTGRSDQTGLVGDTQADFAEDRQTDFYLEDMEGGDTDMEGSDTEGSGSDYNSYSSLNPAPDSSYSSAMGSSADSIDVDSTYSSGDEMPSSSIYGSLHLNQVYIDAYNDPESIEYQRLENEFNLAMDELMRASPLQDSYISTRVVGFSPGSVKVDFVVEMEETARAEGAIKTVISSAIEAGSLMDLDPEPETLVVKKTERPTDPEITFTTKPTSSPDTTKTMKNPEDPDVYRPKDPKDGDEVDVEEKNIIDMILGDPIIIAAIAGGLIVILLSIILLFLFVVYRLKKKDEGSYSLDEPAKAKDPTAYWKETKEFYA